MNQANVDKYFGPEQAAGYDDRWRHTAGARDAMHLLLRLNFMGLPKDARILCVGAGTGAEILFLSEAFPGWHFTAVEPAKAMLDIFRDKAKAAGIADRCEFHEGFLGTLPASEPFHAATSILVSHFIVERQARVSFFRQIRARLREGSLLVNADLSSALEPTAKEILYEQWLRFQTGRAHNEGTFADSPWKGNVEFSKPAEVVAMIEEAGFKSVLPTFQFLFINGWLAKV
ncbi:MAG: class I SAM-dependent methyltransferase [Proteobacteria bacterium]|nr:MAG: class I SAM-dependent methyltransferase [Pseudomonadota bacterium]